MPSDSGLDDRGPGRVPAGQRLEDRGGDHGDGVGPVGDPPRRATTDHQADRGGRGDPAPGARATRVERDDGSDRRQRSPDGRAPARARRAGGVDGRAGDRRADAPAAQPELRGDAVPDLRRGRDERGVGAAGPGEPDDVAQGRQLVGAPLALLDVREVGRACRRSRRGRGARAGRRPRGTHRTAPSTSHRVRSRARLRRTWLLTVPSGRSSRCAIWSCVRSSKNASRRMVRCGSPEPVQLVGDDDAVDHPVVDGRHGQLGRAGHGLVPQPPVAGPLLVGVRDDVPGDAQDPGGEPGLVRVEPFPAAPRLDEHLLRHVLRVGDAAERAERDGVHERGPATVRLGDRGLVAPRERRAELLDALAVRVEPVRRARRVSRPGRGCAHGRLLPRRPPDDRSAHQRSHGYPPIGSAVTTTLSV